MNAIKHTATAILLAVSLATAAAQDQTDEEFLFVQIAESATFADGVLTLSAGSTTAFFSDRPERKVGFITHQELINAWHAGADSFASDPPNASITVRHEGKPQLAIVELSDPELVEAKMIYRVKVLEGSLPANLGQTSVFIDAGGLMQLVAYGAQDTY
jgi:hypothetical protein